jgi:DNA polymerase III epsilon subunit-like protein
MMQGICIKNDWKFVRRMIDTRALAVAMFKGIKRNGDLLPWQIKLVNVREKGLKAIQAFLLKHFEIDHDPSKLHNALYDIKMNYAVFRKLISEVEV